ncbi:MAG TPA: hypothetical protein VKP88_08855, partial [Candidatus Paceibacterota bacterium]|nr:hypothetical protein [Candidatus Paceibacterota bacterium]
MPYEIRDDTCIYNSDTNELVHCHETQDDALAQLAALEANVTDVKSYYKGNAVKALPNGKVEGLLIAFTDEGTRDLADQYFDTTTDLVLSDYPIEGVSVLYNHGFDPTLSIKKIGRIVKARIDDVGVWVQAQLDMRDEYEEQIYKLAEQGVLAWSSGALPQSIKYDETGRHIKRWAVIEGSLTPTPAMPQYTIVSTTKAHPIELDAKEDAPQNNATPSNTDEPTTEVTTQIDKEPVMSTMKRSE